MTGLIKKVKFFLFEEGGGIYGYIVVASIIVAVHHYLFPWAN